MTHFDDSVYTQLEDLLNLRFHVKPYKLGHQQRVNAQSVGSHRAIRKGRGMEFSEVRAYQPGDDIRHIDWRVSARTQKTHTKVFTEELDRPVICLVEQSPQLFFGSHIRFKTDQALRILAAIGWSTLNQGDKMGGLIFNHLTTHWVEPKHQKQGLMNLFHTGLSLQKQLTPQAATTNLWLSNLKQLQKTARPGQKCFLIGDFLNFSDAAFGLLMNLKRHIDINVIHIVDRLEMTLSDIGLVKMTDGVSQLQINTTEEKFRKDYAQSYQKQWDEIQQKFLKLKMPIFMVSAQEDAVAALLQKGILR